MQPQLTIIYPPTVDWFLLFQRPQQLMLSFSKLPGVRCIFLSTEVYRKLGTPVFSVAKDMYVVSMGYNYDHLIEGKTVLWFSYPPHFREALKRKYDLVVFDAIDNPADEFSDWATDIREAEKAADLISCTADIMYQQHVKSDKPVFMCPNGADYSHFRQAMNRLTRPADLPRVLPGEKVIGFYGAMASWVDYDIIIKLAEKYKVVLIGNNKYYKNSLSHPNIINLDHKDYQSLPLYLSHFDATIIPFKLTEMIKGCDPIKFYEYLSAGKPILATEMDELKKYADVTYFINYDNVQEVAHQALAEDSPKKRYDRINVARENSWDARAKVAIDMIYKHLK